MTSILAAFGLIFWALSWLLPNHYAPWTSFYLEALAFAGLLCLLPLMLQERRLLIPRCAVFVCTLIPLVWLQWVVGLVAFAGDAWTATLYLFCTAAALTLGFNLQGKHQWLQKFLGVLVLAAVASTFLALMQWLRLESQLGIFIANMPPAGRAFANLGQPNHFAGLVLLGLLALYYFYLTGAMGWATCLLLAAVLTWGLVMSESRAALLCAPVLVLAYFYVRRAKLPQLPVWPVLLWLVGLILAWMAWQPVCEALYLAPSRTEILASSSGRVVMYKQVLVGIAQSPWWGYGWRQTAAAQYAGAPFVAGSIGLTTEYAHNLFFDLLAWFGVPLGLLFAAVLVRYFWNCFKSISSLDAACALGAVLILLVHSLFEFPFAYAYFLLPCAVFLGMAREQNTAVAFQMPPDFAWIVFLPLTIWLALIAKEYLAIEEDYRVMRFELLRTGATPAGYQATSVRWLTQLDAQLRAARLVLKSSMPAAEMGQLRAVMLRFPSPLFHLKYIHALQLNGQFERADQELKTFKAWHALEI